MGSDTALTWTLSGAERPRVSRLSVSIYHYPMPRNASYLRQHCVEVMIEFILGSADITNTAGLVSWSTSSPEDLEQTTWSAEGCAGSRIIAPHLQHVQDGQIDETTSASIVY